MARARTPVVAVVVALALGAGAGAAAAQKPDPFDPANYVAPPDQLWERAFTVSFDPAVSMPVGDFGRIAGIGVGTGLRVEYRAHWLVRVVAHGNWVFHLVKNEITTNEFSGMAGVDLFPREGEPEFLYVEGGVSHLRFSSEELSTLPENGTEPAAGIGAGYDGGRFAVRMGVWVPEIDNIDFGVAIMAKLSVRVFGLGTPPRAR